MVIVIDLLCIVVLICIICCELARRTSYCETMSWESLSTVERCWFWWTFSRSLLPSMKSFLCSGTPFLHLSVLMYHGLVV